MGVVIMVFIVYPYIPLGVFTATTSDSMYTSRTDKKTLGQIFLWRGVAYHSIAE